nr:S-adenosylmethionine hydrolase [synthetic construct]ASF62317.1 S-adenosylmethionine hydrolase [synthetic construct]
MRGSHHHHHHTDPALRFDFFIGLTTQDGVQLVLSEVIQQHVVPLLADYGIDGFTTTTGIGFWNGMPETVLIVTVFDNYGPNVEWHNIVSSRLASELDQEVILVSTTPVNANLIGACHGLKSVHFVSPGKWDRQLGRRKGREALRPDQLCIRLRTLIEASWISAARSVRKS